MVFNKLFGGEREPFLVLSENDGSAPVSVAPVVDAPEQADAAEPVKAQATLLVSQAEGSAATAASASTSAAAATPAPTQPAAEAPAAPSSAASLTTAELLAAERAEEAKNAVPRSTTTFAAELLNPAAVLPKRRRRPGAAIAGYKQMATGLMRSASAAGAAEG
ncbi:MAG: hypothetical protein VKJ31_03365 [Synechococcus sp.]|nr:hypothetical protein [Synechococcus sp.]